MSSTAPPLVGLAGKDFEVAPEPSFLLELEGGRIVCANVAAGSLTGRAPDELGGVRFDALAPPTTISPFERLLDQAKRDGAASAIDLTLFDAAGTPVPVHADAWLADGGDRRLLRVIVHDGSELARERSERARRRGAQRIAVLGEDRDARELLDELLDESIALTESRFGYLYRYDEESRQFTLHAWSREVMRACTILAPQTIYQLERTGIWGEAVRQRRAILVNDFAAENPLKRGYPQGHAELRRFLTVPVIRAGRIVAVVGVANRETPYTQHDAAMLERFLGDAWHVVERRIERETFDEARRRLELALEGAHAGTFHWDASFDQTQWDDRLLGIYGIARADLDGRARPWSTRVHAEDRGRNEAAFARLLLDGGPFYLQYRVVGDDGRVRTCRLRAELLRDGKGDVRGMSGLVFDVTEATRLEEERKRIEQRVAQAQRIAGLELLARGVAHEFNNLLQVVLGSAWELAQSLPPDAAAHELVSAIEGASHRGAEVCRHLLACAGRDVGAPQRIDLSELVGAMEDTIRGASPQRRLELELRRDLPAVVADPLPLREALLGLCANASEAQPPEGGAIAIETGVAQCDAALLSTAVAIAEHACAGRFVWFEVRDDGCGMDAQTQEHLFEPFFSTKGFGRGLGLATVLGLVRAHGGFVTLRSAPGQGSRVRVWLPAAAPASVHFAEAIGAAATSESAH